MFKFNFNVIMVNSCVFSKFVGSIYTTMIGSFPSNIWLEVRKGHVAVPKKLVHR
jgi:hypothetical protein